MQITLRNLGTVNKNRVDLGQLTVWFSYETPVGFSFKGTYRVRENDWSTTTGKLLNELEPDKSKRIKGEDFEKELNAILATLSFNETVAA